LRKGFPDARIELVGYRHICAVANGRHYADAVRSIEYAAMAAFFCPGAPLDPELSDYFSGFGQVVSYLYDPDGFFRGNLLRCGVRNLIEGSPRIPRDLHAAHHLAKPLESLALFLDNPSARIFPSEADRADAAQLLASLPGPRIALHPGSGSEAKNWPLSSWVELATGLLLENPEHSLVIVGGECEGDRLAALRQALSHSQRCLFLEVPPLPTLGAIFADCNLFVGHDSGVSHLAAAAGCDCLLMFGPTDPFVWAPASPGVRVLRSSDGTMASIPLPTVREQIAHILHGRN